MPKQTNAEFIIPKLRILRIWVFVRTNEPVPQNILLLSILARLIFRASERKYFYEARLEKYGAEVRY